MAKEISNINESIYEQFLYKKALEDDEDFLCLQTYHLRYVYHVGIVRIALFCPKEATWQGFLLFQEINWS